MCKNNNMLGFAVFLTLPLSLPFLLQRYVCRIFYFTYDLILCMWKISKGTII